MKVTKLLHRKSYIFTYENVFVQVGEVARAPTSHPSKEDCKVLGFLVRTKLEE
jgi:hypothetical protein